jgi:hypothetical protein
VQNRILNCTPQAQVQIPAGTVLFALWGQFFLCDSHKHSLLLPTFFTACFCIRQKVLLVVRVVGFFLHWKLPFWVFLLWTGLALQTLFFAQFFF